MVGVVTTAWLASLTEILRLLPVGMAMVIDLTEFWVGDVQGVKSAVDKHT